MSASSSASPSTLSKHTMPPPETHVVRKYFNGSTNVKATLAANPGLRPIHAEIAAQLAELRASSKDKTAVRDAQRATFNAMYELENHGCTSEFVRLCKAMDDALWRVSQAPQEPPLAFWTFGSAKRVLFCSRQCFLLYAGLGGGYRMGIESNEELGLFRCAACDKLTHMRSIQEFQKAKDEARSV